MGADPTKRWSSGRPAAGRVYRDVQMSEVGPGGAERPLDTGLVVTSMGWKVAPPPIDAATSAPADEGRSRIATCAPTMTAPLPLMSRGALA